MPSPSCEPLHYKSIAVCLSALGHLGSGVRWSSNDQNPTVEGIYDDGSNLGEVSTNFNDDLEKERFEEPGDIVEKRNIILKVTSGESYNYQLELRNKGLVIKALDNSSVSFIESNKGLVIQSAISEVMSIVGFVKSQIKTIIIDIKEKF